MTYKDRIRREMKVRGITKLELGLRLGITLQSVCDWIQEDEPPLYRAQEIADALGVSSEFLLLGVIQRPYDRAQASVELRFLTALRRMSPEQAAALLTMMEAFLDMAEEPNTPST